MSSKPSPNSSYPSYEGSPHLAAFAKSLFDTLEKERKEGNKKPPDELIALIKSTFSPTEKTLGFFEKNDLETIKDIARFGSTDVKTLLTPFPLSYLVDKEFLDFIKIVHLMSKFFQEIGETLRAQDTPLHINNPEDFLQYLPSSTVKTISFINQLNTDSLNRSIRSNLRHFKVELKTAIDDLFSYNDDSGSLITSVSKSSRGDTNNQHQNANEGEDDISTTFKVSTSIKSQEKTHRRKYSSSSSKQSTQRSVPTTNPKSTTPPPVSPENSFKSVKWQGINFSPQLTKTPSTTQQSSNPRVNQEEDSHKYTPVKSPQASYQEPSFDWAKYALMQPPKEEDIPHWDKVQVQQYLWDNRNNLQGSSPMLALPKEETPDAAAKPPE